MGVILRRPNTSVRLYENPEWTVIYTFKVEDNFTRQRLTVIYVCTFIIPPGKEILNEIGRRLSKSTLFNL